MNNKKWKKIGRDMLFFFLVFAGATGLCILLSRIVNDNNPFATPIFILAVALISRYTSGYLYGVAASVIGVIAVNYIFTFPFLEFDLSISGYPLTFGAMLLVSIIISTLTTQIKKQEQLRFEAEKEKMRANLLRSVSHDIRTPLTSIMGASSVLLENRELPQEQHDDLLSEINKDARWLVRVTENILSITKFSGGDVLLQKTEEVVEEITGSAIVKFRRNHPQIPVTVTKPEEILLVPMDATLIEQVLLNLFENVAMHGETATHIWVDITRQGKKAFISVKDNGAGIPSEILPNILNGYLFSVTQNNSDTHRNMGIGLTVCQSIIRAHGGEITAANNETGGATFQFWLPCEEDPNEQ